MRVFAAHSVYTGSVDTTLQQPAVTNAAAPAREPAREDNPFGGYTPPHTQTQSTLAPTAEFTRIFLLAWIIRYVFRGASGTLFEKSTTELAKTAPRGLRDKIVDALSWPGRAFKGAFFPKVPLSEMEAATYAGAIGVGSAALSYRYSKMVKSDIHNIFRESVAYEHDKPQADVTFNDINASDNRIVKRTVENYRSKLFGRLGTDALFGLAAVLRHGPLTDLFLGLKGVQIFADTWKRKTTMFEDLITFVNNKINPRNGLGQQISVGDIFDLYQHYAEAFAPNRMFKNVIEGGNGEGTLWAKNQAIFQRMTELMNLTYAYKHRSVLDETSGKPIAQADFALPKFVYLLGHDLIDVNRPEETALRIEVANRYGIGAVKEMQRALAGGASLASIAERFPIAPHAAAGADKPNEKNGVIAKGSTMQLERAELPNSQVRSETITHQAPAPALAPAI